MAIVNVAELEKGWQGIPGFTKEEFAMLDRLGAFWDPINVRTNKILQKLVDTGEYEGLKVGKFPGHVGWSGWKNNLNNLAVGQILDWRRGAEGIYYVCNLPGLQYHQYRRMESFDIGLERVDHHITDAEIEALLVAGLNLVYGRTN